MKNEEGKCQLPNRCEHLFRCHQINGEDFYVCDYCQFSELETTQEEVIDKLKTKIEKLEHAVKLLSGMGVYYSMMVCFGNPESAKHARLVLKQVDEILGEKC